MGMEFAEVGDIGRRGKDKLVVLRGIRGMCAGASTRLKRLFGFEWIRECGTKGGLMLCAEKLGCLAAGKV